MSDSDARIAVLGAAGQAGRALTRALGARALPLTRSDIDLADLRSAAERLDELRPTAIVNAAAYTAVDRAESEPDLAFQINAEAPGFLVRWCEDRGIPFVHFSTDYVFSGAGTRPWSEDDAACPINVYGRSKLEGEIQVAAAGGRWLILRTSWVYDGAGRNFLTTILKLAAEQETLSVVDDQWGAPTYAPHLAAAALTALLKGSASPVFPAGIYHVCNGGETTWYAFAGALLDAARAGGRSFALRSLAPIATPELPSPACRPLNSRLNTEKLRQTFGITLPHWQDALADCMRDLLRPVEPSEPP